MPRGHQDSFLVEERSRDLLFRSARARSRGNRVIHRSMARWHAGG
ncbi:MAG: hypothetical protein AVDCRST_MAG06-2724 [uncultured Nocardioides sp.]|uniref:Uncharacterized protein n=1 Tax=uncultured Nocardioides sp. TaxID=198441 RepID=A0A6J4PA78_9ACTN|nr:MAG: hypothetical protein AVDCRST_MAG06-2724 [uncultured Nocardioides sp.]